MDAIEKFADQKWGDIRCCPAHDCDYREGLIEAIKLLQRHAGPLDQELCSRDECVHCETVRFLRGLSDD